MKKLMVNLVDRLHQHKSPPALPPRPPPQKLEFDSVAKQIDTTTPSGAARTGEQLFVDDVVLGLPAPPGAVVYNGSIAQTSRHKAVVYRVDGEVAPHGLGTQLFMAQLDDDWGTCGPPSTLETRSSAAIAPTAEDPRLIAFRERFFVAYNSTSDGTLYGSPRGMFLLEAAAIVQNGQASFSTLRRKRIKMQGIQERMTEKNWTPFVRGHELCFIYRTNPPIIGALSPEQWNSDEHEVTLKRLPTLGNPVASAFGEMRGGTPALSIDGGASYLSFFHTFRVIGKKRNFESFDTAAQVPYAALYMAGAYTFEGAPPFGLQKMTHMPLVPPSAHDDVDLLQDEVKKLGWITYPTGIVFDQPKEMLYVSYSQNDLRVRLLVIDAKALRKLMTPVVDQDDVLG